MPRDASGNFTLVSGNPVVSGTIITSDWANTTMPDLALGLQDSLDRFGRGGMEVPFKVPDGSGVAPGYAFVNEPSLGFYRAGAGQLGVAVGGAGRLFLSSALWDSIVPMRLNAQNTGTQLTVKQGSAQTEAILRVISNDELTEYLAIDNAGQVTIDDLVVSNTPTIPGYATLGANTFIGDQTITKAGPVLNMNASSGSSRLAFSETGSVKAYLGYNTSNQLYLQNTTSGATILMPDSSNDVNISTGTLQQGGVPVSTLGANTFTGDQVISKVTPVLNLNASSGNVLIALSRAGVAMGYLGYNTSNQLYLQNTTSGATILMPNGSSVVNISTGTLQQAGVNVATVNANWLLSDITDVTATATEVNYTDGVTSAIQPQLNSKAPLASPALTGTPTAPTAAAGTNTTQLATTAFVQDSFSFKGFSARISSSVAMTGSDNKTVNTTNFPSLSENWDTDAWFNPATGRFQPDEAGVYLVSIHVSALGLTSGANLYFFKNGVIDRYIQSNGTDTVRDSFSFEYSLNGSTDYIEFKIDPGADTAWTVSDLTVQGSRQ